MRGLWLLEWWRKSLWGGEEKKPECQSFLASGAEHRARPSEISLEGRCVAATFGAVVAEVCAGLIYAVEECRERCEDPLVIDRFEEGKGGKRM